MSISATASPSRNTEDLDVSIILINWRMREDLEKCLQSIANHQHNSSSEVIVINKPSGDGTEELIRDHHPNVRLFDHPTFGFSTMRNAGITKAKGRYCLVLDTDIELHDGCFDNMVKFMDRNPSVAGCGGKTVRLNGELEYNVKRFYDLMTVIVRRSPVEKFWPNNPWSARHLMTDKDHNRPYEGDWMAGACFCIRKTSIAKIGFFDEKMHYFEDVDWCWRAKAAGFRIAYNPYSSLTHKVQGLSKKSPFSKKALIHLFSGLRFWWKIHHKGLDWAWPERPDTFRKDQPVDDDSIVPADQPHLSVIIVNWNAADLLDDCLNSLKEAAPRHRLQVIVVDNKSHDDSVKRVRKNHPDVELFAMEDNLGFTKGNNVGIKAAHGKYVLLLNNDTSVLPGAFSDALDYMEENPTVGAAGLKLLNGDGSLQLSCRRFPSFSQALFNRYSLLTKLWPNNPVSRSYLMSDIAHDEIRDVDWVSGACLLVRRSVIERIGMLDERFFMYSEDVDFCYRIWQAGWRISYLPFAQVYHYIGHSSKRARVRTTLERHRSMYLFYKKHYSRNLMFLDVATGAMVSARCIIHVAIAAIQNQFPEKSRS